MSLPQSLAASWTADAETCEHESPIRHERVCASMVDIGWARVRPQKLPFAKWGCSFICNAGHLTWGRRFKRKTMAANDVGDACAVRAAVVQFGTRWVARGCAAMLECRVAKFRGVECDGDRCGFDGREWQTR